jgi:hypothetical protein
MPFFFATVSFMRACHRWNEKEAADKTWTNLKIQFAAARRQHKQMQDESSANSGYHAANAAVGETEEQMDETTVKTLENLATETAADHGGVATLTEANARLVRQLDECSKEVKDVKALLKRSVMKEEGRPFTPSLEHYCWSHGYKVTKSHTSQS